MTTETKPTPAPAAKPAAPAPAAKAPPAPKAVAPVYALMRINGVHVPGDIFTPASEAQRVELVETLEAARDLSAAELALFEKINAAAATDEDPIG